MTSVRLCYFLHVSHFLTKLCTVCILPAFHYFYSLVQSSRTDIDNEIGQFLCCGLPNGGILVQRNLTGFIQILYPNTRLSKPNEKISLRVRINLNMFILIQEAISSGLLEQTIDLNYWSSHYAIREVLNKLILDNNYRKRIFDITIVINDLADELLPNVQRMIIKNGLDPVDIPDQNLEYYAGKVYLRKGRLENVSNMKRYNDVSINYRVSMKKVTFSLPIKFDILKFIYQYHSIMWSLTAKGEVQANLKYMKAKIVISFDFEKYVVSLDKFNITDEGQLSVSYSGYGFLDWIFGLSSTSSMHSSMIQDIRNTVTEELEKIIAKINSTLKFILQE